MPTATRIKKSIPFGRHATSQKDYLYALGGGRILYAFASLQQHKPLRRFSAQIVLALSPEPFQLTVEGQTQHHRAALIKPRVERLCRAREGLGFQLSPSHPAFPSFRTLPASGVLALDRALFQAFDADLERAHGGQLSAEDASRLFNDVLQLVLSQLPKIPPLDGRVQRVLDLLKANPQFPLQELAKQVGLSYYRLSHLFVEQTGLPLRSFQLWRKVDAAVRLIPGMNITEAARRAGFVDPAHLSHAFEQLHAATPSYFVDSNYVTIIARTSAKK